MKKKIGMTIATWLLLLLTSCSGMKVIHPNDQNENADALAVDVTDGKMKLVGTYTCNLVASNGQRVSAIGKTEDEARKEAVAKCREKTLLSFCEPKNAKCVKN